MDDARRQAILELWWQGRAAWPQFEVADDDFVAHVSRHLEPEVAAADIVSRLRAEDLYLACACAAAHPEALRAFEAQVLPACGSALARLDPSSDFADEVKQQLRDKLLVGRAGHPPKIADYAGRGPLVTWVRVAAVRTGINARASGQRAAAMSIDRAQALAPAVAADPDLDYIRRRYAAEFEGALTDACRGLSSRDRTVLRLKFVDGLNIDQIGGVYGVHRATVARWISSARDQLFSGVREGLAAKLHLSQAEFDSLLRAVQSQLDISLTGLLRSTTDEDRIEG